MQRLDLDVEGASLWHEFPVHFPRPNLRFYYDLSDHMLHFMESADIVVCAGRPEGMFIGLVRIQIPGVKPLRTLRQFNVLGVCRLARIGGYRVYLAR